MHPKLKSELFEIIEKWAADNCEEDYWAEHGVFGRDLATCMTNAAEAVYDGIVNSFEYAEKQGYIRPA